MNSLPQIDFGKIRQHESSQQRAWEELAYLLISDIELLPSGTLLERRGSPDGGIEFSCRAPDGAGRWAWQAKFLFRLDASAFAQMTKSIEAGLESTPDLDRYTFVLPIDRTAHKTPRGKNGMQKWGEHKLSWEAAAEARGMTVDFQYVGHSDVVAALQAEKNAGAVRYFFDATLLTREFFEKQVGREIANLGDRYDPAVHVELEIKDVLDAVCRSRRFGQRIAVSFHKLDRERATMPAGALANESLGMAIADLDTVARAAQSAGQSAASRVRSPDTTVLSELARAVGPVLDKVAIVDQLAREALDALPAPRAGGSPPVKATRRTRGKTASASETKAAAVETQRRALYGLMDAAWRVRSAAEHALHVLTDDQSRAARRAALILEGPAGCGKSHLIADAAKERVDDNLPTLLVLGQQLSVGPIWPQIAQSIGVDLTGPELLQALEVAAQVRDQGRALIAIDAINEGAGADLWAERLPGFLTELTAYPWVAVVLTVRDTYAASLIPAGHTDDATVRLAHPGLASHEEEALSRYSQHYGLRLPDVPPLLPELTNPLFLRTLCRSVKARGLDAIPREAASLAWVFEGLILAVNERLSHRRRLDVDPDDDLVGKAVVALADAMLDADDEVLPTPTAKRICQTLYSEKQHSKSLLEGLIAEGLLLRERIRRPEGLAREYSDQIRFTYQRLSDHLRGEALMNRHPSDNDLAVAVRALATGEHAWARAGLVEALVLQTPEQRGVELALLLKLGPPRRRSHDPWAAEPWSGRRWLRRTLERAFFSTLPWRNPGHITDATRQLARDYLRLGAISEYEWLSLLLGLACVPKHPLNVGVIDGFLRQKTLPERDAVWSDLVLGIWSDDSSPVARTIDWIWSGEAQPPDDVAELAATLLAWLLSSPNRRLRDSATKSLLRLVERRTPLVTQLLSSFADVDDPYILERLLAVACGHAIRHRKLTPSGELLDEIDHMGCCIFDLVFEGNVPDHLLIRHYARTCVEVIDAVLRAHGRHLDRDLKRARPPYGSQWPLTAPSVTALARGFGRKRTKYITSATVLGYDFEHYVIERGIAMDFVLPNQRRRQAARRAAGRRAVARIRLRLLEAVPARKRTAVAKGVDAALVSPGSRRSEREAWNAVSSIVPAKARSIVEDLERAATSLKAVDRTPVRPDPGLLARWIAQRILELGWNEDRFGERDRSLARARGGGWSETERFGKKFAWIAFYEVLGRLADHCALHKEWRESAPVAYDNPWQIGHAPDLDPTVVLRGDEPPERSSAGRLRRLRIATERRNAWWLDAYRRSLRSTGSDRDWLFDPGDIPRADSLLAFLDPEGNEWVVLESHATWRLGDGANADDGARREMWVRSQASLIPATDRDEVSRWAADQDWMGVWMPTPPDFPAGPLGSYPDLPPWPAGLAMIDDERRNEGDTHNDLPHGWERAERRYGDNGTDPRVVLALTTHGWRSGTDRDRSAVDLPGAILPSPLLLDLLAAVWAGSNTRPADDLGLGAVETEYSWLADGQVVAFATGGRGYGDASLLCVRADSLRRAVESADLLVWSWVLGEKIYWSHGEPSGERAELSAAVALTPTIESWGTTVEHKQWQEGTRVGTRVLTERLHR